MTARLLCAIAVAGISAVALAQENPGPQVMLTIKLYEKAADGKQARMLAEPSIVATIGRPFTVGSGRAIQPKNGDGELHFGTFTSGTLRDAPGGAFRVAVKIELGAKVPLKDDQETDLIRTDSLEIRTIVRSGETKRFQCSATEWCEIRVTPRSESVGAKESLLGSRPVTK